MGHREIQLPKHGESDFFIVRWRSLECGLTKSEFMSPDKVKDLAANGDAQIEEISLPLSSSFFENKFWVVQTGAKARRETLSTYGVLKALVKYGPELIYVGGPCDSRFAREMCEDEIKIPGTCPYCHSDFQSRESLVRCSSCDALHHERCWYANHRCSVYGCSGQKPLSYNPRAPAFPRPPVHLYNLPTVHAEFYCDQCGKLACVIGTKPPGPTFTIAGFLYDGECGFGIVNFNKEKASEFVAALQAPDAGRLYALHEYCAPFYCPECKKCYCLEHWNPFHYYSRDVTHGNCPLKHHRIIND